MNETERFEQWAVVEVFGHKKFAGLVTEQTIGGCAFVRVDVPEVEGRPAFTKLFGQGAIYCVTPTTEEVARMAAARTWTDPLPVYIPELQPRQEIWAPALTAGAPIDLNLCEGDTCRVCGCTDDRACEGGCYWVEEDLCSHCVGKEPEQP